jgi:hypothetical protein
MQTAGGDDPEDGGSDAGGLGRGVCSEEDLAQLGVAWDAELGFDQYCREVLRKQAVQYGSWIDKHAVKLKVVDIVPDIKVARTLFVTGDANAFTNDLVTALPDKYVVKATHASQMTILMDGQRGNCLRVAKAHKHKFCTRWTVLGKMNHAKFLQENCARWLEIDFGKLTNQRMYSTIPPQCIVEEHLANEQGESPPDVKVYVVHGVPMFMYLTPSQDRKEEFDGFPGEVMPFNPFSGALMMVSPAGELIPAAKHKRHQDACKRCNQQPPPKLPTRLHSRYLELATRLSAGFAAVRVDFFADETEPVFQELTFTTDNCRPSFVPAILSRALHYLASHPKVRINPSCLARAVASTVCPCALETNKSSTMWRTMLQFDVASL